MKRVIVIATHLPYPVPPSSASSFSTKSATPGSGAFPEVLGRSGR